MADVSSTSEQLKIENYFVDGDTRMITLKNPRQSITTSDIEELQAYMRANNIIVGDKMGGTFGKISKVTRVTETKTYVDFT